MIGVIRGMVCMAIKRFKLQQQEVTIVSVVVSEIVSVILSVVVYILGHTIGLSEECGVVMVTICIISWRCSIMSARDGHMIHIVGHMIHIVIIVMIR